MEYIPNMPQRGPQNIDCIVPGDDTSTPAYELIGKQAHPYIIVLPSVAALPGITKQIDAFRGAAESHIHVEWRESGGKLNIRHLLGQYSLAAIDILIVADELQAEALWRELKNISGETSAIPIGHIFNLTKIEPRPVNSDTSIMPLHLHT